MKTLLKILAVILVLSAAGVGAALYLLKDPNRFKPRIEALIRDTSGYEVDLAGDLAWQLWPPVVLKGTDIRFSDDSTDYALAAFGVRANLLPLVTGGELEITQLRLDDLVMTDREFDGVTRVDRLRLDNFSIGEPSPLRVEATLVGADGVDSKVTIEGPLTYFSDADRLTIKPMAFDYDGIRGSCDVAASELSREPIFTSRPTADDLLPLDTVRAIDWEVSCTIPELATESQTLRNLAVTSANAGARMANRIEVPDAFGGRVTTTVDIDSRKRPPVWTVDTDANDIQSQALMDVLAPSLTWAAPLLAGGKLTLTGNTMDALVESASGRIALQSTAGRIDIGAIKDAVLGLAQLAGKGEEVARWQRELAYTTLDGSWTVDGTDQDIQFSIDNLELKAMGLLNALSGAMDLRATVTVEDNPELDVLKVSEELYGLPIPLRCRGTLDVPDCGLDSEAAQQTLADYASGRLKGEASEKLDELLQEKVPEEYQESAKELLKGLFGGSREERD
ncbi:MAG: AsmA family protein [Pseudomonadota bacterium]